MNANPLNLTPSQAVWGAFYAALRQEVEKLTALEATLASDSSAADDQAKRMTRPGNSTSRRRSGQVGGEK